MCTKCTDFANLLHKLQSCTFLMYTLFVSKNDKIGPRGVQNAPYRAGSRKKSGFLRGAPRAGVFCTFLQILQVCKVCTILYNMCMHMCKIADTCTRCVVCTHNFYQVVRFVCKKLRKLVFATTKLQLQHVLQHVLHAFLCMQHHFCVAFLLTCT